MGPHSFWWRVAALCAAAALVTPARAQDTSSTSTTTTTTTTTTSTSPWPTTNYTDPSYPQPILQSLAISRTYSTADAFDPYAPDFNVTLFSNEPVVIAAQAPVGSFVNMHPPLPIKGTVDGWSIFSYTPREYHGEENFDVFVTNQDKTVTSNYTINVETVTSIDPTVAAVNVSPGRLEPRFTNHVFAYYARVPEGTSKVNIDFTAFNDKDTSCSINGGPLQKGKGSAKVNAFGGLFGGDQHPVITIDCVAADPLYKVRYTFTVVEQLGGSTMLRYIRPVGATLAPAFDPEYDGPYQIDLGFQNARDLKWTAFEVDTKNEKAIVKIDGQEVDLMNNITPFYNLVGGEERKFRIAVRTAENPVEETYDILVKRPGEWNPYFKSGESLGFTSMVVSSYGGAVPVAANYKFLQWLSVSHWLNGNPEGYDALTKSMHKWNHQREHDDVRMLNYPADIAIGETPYEGIIRTKHYKTVLQEMKEHLSENQTEIQAYESISAVVSETSPWGEEHVESLVNDLASSIQMAQYSPSKGKWVDAMSPQSLKRAVRNVVRSQLVHFAEGNKDVEDHGSYDGAHIVSMRRRLADVLASPSEGINALSPEEKQQLIPLLDSQYKQEQKLLYYSYTLVTSTGLLLGLGIVYALVWVFYLRSAEDFKQLRQDFPVWLHPSRFWMFIFDFFLIAYIQACVGLMWYSHDDVSVHLFGSNFKPGDFMWLMGTMLVIYPVAFIGVNAWLLTRIQQETVWSRCLNRYHDRDLYEGNARAEYCKWLPKFIRQMFTFEITRVMPIVRPIKKKETITEDILFAEETYAGGPWNSAEPKDTAINSTEQDEGSDKSLREPALDYEALGALDHDHYYDRVRVQLHASEMEMMSAQVIDPNNPDGGKAVRPVFSEYSEYQMNNDKSVRNHPHAVVGYDMYKVKNPYDTSFCLLTEVQLQHLPNLTLTNEDPCFYVPYENLRLINVNLWNMVFGGSQRGNIFYWAIDRIATLGLLIMMHSWLDQSGTIQKIIFMATSFCLFAFFLPFAIASGSGKWYKLMQLGYYRIEEEEKRKKNREEKMKTWPFGQQAAREKLERDMSREGQVCCAPNQVWFDRYLLTPLQNFSELPFWSTRAWVTTKEVAQGPVFSELIKGLVVFEILMGSTSWGFFSEAKADATVVSYLTIALLAMNSKEIVMMLDDCWHLAQEYAIFSRRAMIDTMNYFGDLGSTGSRISHFFSQLLRFITGEKNYSFWYPGTVETVETRDFVVDEIDVIQNETGLYMPGKIRSEKSRIETIRDVLTDNRRVQFQKTLHRNGPIGAWRDQYDRKLPTQLSYKQFQQRKHDNLSDPDDDASKKEANTLAATVQIVNHTFLRYPSSRVSRSTGEDDSYLSLYTDKELIPPAGDIILRKSYGYVCHYDPDLNQLRIKGPNIRAGRRYIASTKGDRAPRQHYQVRRLSVDTMQRSDHETLDTEDSVWSAREVSGSSEAFCVSPGKLEVPVMPRQTPNLHLPFQVTDPNGDQFVINPRVVHVTYSAAERKLILYSRSFMPSTSTYRVQWTVMDKVEPVSGSGTAEDAGLVVIQLDKRGTPDLKKTLILQDASNEDLGAHVDPRQTDAYVLTLPKATVTGCGRIGASFRQIMNEEINPADNFPQAVPCTIVQCLDPVNGVMRVEPNFDAAVRMQTAALEEVIGMQEDSRNPRNLGALTAAALTPQQLAAIFKEKGIDLTEDGRTVNPFILTKHRIAMQNSRQIEEIKARVIDEIERHLEARAAALRERIQATKDWAKAYNDTDLSAALYKKDDAMSAAAPSESQVELAVSNLVSLKKQWENIDGFIYPMNVDAKLLSRKPDYQAQLDQWRSQVTRWLVEEEMPISMDADAVDDVTVEVADTVEKIMRAVKHTFFRGENPAKGQFRSVLHYLTDSVSVRGSNVNWKPDPLQATSAHVRIWNTRSDGAADFKQPDWCSCILKLTANSVKIIVTSFKDAEEESTDPTATWRNVTGHQIPLKCFQKVDVIQDPMADLPEVKLVFRKNQQTAVDDHYVKSMKDGLFNNKIDLEEIEASTTQSRSNQFSIMVGHCVPQSEAAQWPNVEVDPTVNSFDNKVNVHPLTFRIPGSQYKKWLDVVQMSGMDRLPEELDEKWDGQVPRELPSESEEPTPEPSESSETLQPSEPPSPKAPTEPSEEELPPPPIQKYIFEEGKYDGEGVLRDEDGNIVYTGGWARGMRWGPGEANLKDKNGLQWKFQGNFVQDEPVGEGRLYLTDENELDRLKNSSDPNDRFAVTAYQGDFSSPHYLNIRRQMSGPEFVGKPRISPDLVKRLLEQNPKGDTVDIGGSEKDGDEVQMGLIVDPRRTLSAAGDLDLMSMPMGELGRMYGQKGGRKNSLESGSEFGGESSYSDLPYNKGGDQNDAMQRDALPHRARALREQDPSLGFQTLFDRFEGHLLFADGAAYKGQLKNGVPHGKGQLNSRNTKMQYRGQWKNGKPHGAGVMEWLDANDQKCRYVGMFSNGKRDGEGAMTSKDGRMYLEGNWVNDDMDGAKGTRKAIVWIDPQTAEASKLPIQSFVGPMENGRFKGESKVTFGDRSVYVGGLDGSKREGKGVMTGAGGDMNLLGSWKNDSPTGRVQKMVLPSGKMYCGDIVQGKRQGMGELYRDSKGGLLYEGLWMNDLPHGRGTAMCPDGVYEGEFKDGRRSGKGKFTYSDVKASDGRNRVYEGDWSNDMQHGVGRYLSENAWDVTLQFEKGEATSESLNKFKRAGCGRQTPGLGMSPAVQRLQFEQEKYPHWGGRKALSDDGVSSLLATMNGGHPYEAYQNSTAPCDPSATTEVRDLSMRPLDRPRMGTRAPRTEKVISCTLHDAKNLPITHRSGKVEPFVRVKVGNRSKDTKTFEHNTSPNVQLEDQTLRFFFDPNNTRHENLKVQIWDRASGRPEFVGTAAMNLQEMWSAGKMAGTHSLNLLNHSQPAGAVKMSIDVGDASSDLSSGASSSEDSFGSLAGAPSTVISAAQDLLGDQLKIEVHSAKHLRSLQTESGMAPFVKVTVDKNSHKTRRDRRGDKNPMWTESFAFPVDFKQPSIFVQFGVFHKGSDGQERLIGSGEVDMSQRELFSDEVKLHAVEAGEHVVAGKLVATVKRVYT